MPSLRAQGTATYEADLPLFDKENQIGDVKVTIEGESLKTVDRDSLLNALRSYLKSDTMKSLTNLPLSIDAARMPMGLRFDPVDLKLVMNLSLDKRKEENLDIAEGHQHRYDGESLAPATFGGAVNYRLEQSWATLPEDRRFTGQMDSFVNMNGVVLENQTLYQTNAEREWYRGDTRLVKDFQKALIRVQAGDVYPQIQGFMSGRALGGINISRNFSLNPYRLPYPTASQAFSLQARSFVKYFVNGSLIKSEFLPAGNYSAKDIPLSNGMNTVVVEATDDLGQKKTFIFRTATSIDLLNKGESRFDASYGVPFIDQNFKRTYVEKDGKLASGFYQYGFRTDFSGSAYIQNQQSFNLLGTELLKATSVGNFGTGYARSMDSDVSGEAGSLRYQYIGQGKRWFETNSLGLRYEQRSRKFKSSIFDSLNSVKNAYSANYALPVASAFTISVGGNYGDMYDNSLSDRYGYDTTLSIRMFNRHNLSFFVGRSRDEFKNWNDIAYVFVTITFPGSNDFMTGFYDKEQKTSRVTYLRDNQNKLYSPRAQGIVENNETFQMGEADVLIPTQIADLGARINARHLVDDDKVIGKGSLRMNSAFVFARDDGDWGFGMSRPVPSSFAIFKPEDKLRGQKIALKSTSPYLESQTGLFDEITYSQLLPYQYREIQLDPTYLDEGRSLKKEKFVLYPTYKSAHLVKLVDQGMVTLKGSLTKTDGTPWPLQVGHAGDKTFFTNREGNFFIEGIEPGSYVLTLEGTTSKIKVDVPENAQGIKDLGSMIMEEDE
ncbi:MAG: hypothetical protein V4598_08265 [Bdellovibrionota bacterium]